MQPRDALGQRRRLAVAALLLICLAGLLLWYGTLPTATPAQNEYPDEDHVGPTPDAYVGEPVVLSGEVVATKPVVIEATYQQGSRQFTLAQPAAAVTNTERAITTGDRVTAFGTLVEPTTLTTERAIVRAPWEFQYMYLVSFLGGCLALGWFCRQWRFDRTRLAFVPREPAPADDSAGPQPASRPETSPTAGESDAATEVPPRASAPEGEH